jgi:hypothetical protein
MSVDAVHGIWPPPEKAVVSYAVAFVSDPTAGAAS